MRRDGPGCRHNYPRSARKPETLSCSLQGSRLSSTHAAVSNHVCCFHASPSGFTCARVSAFWRATKGASMATSAAGQLGACAPASCIWHRSNAHPLPLVKDMSRATACQENPMYQDCQFSFNAKARSLGSSNRAPPRESSTWSDLDPRLLRIGSDTAQPRTLPVHNRP